MSPAIVTRSATLTYADVERRTAQVVAGLRRLGVSPGDRVAVHVDKSPEALLAYLGCLRMGAVFLPLNPAYRSDEVAYFLGDAEPCLAIGRPQDATWFRSVASASGVRSVYDLDANGRGSWSDLLDVESVTNHPVRLRRRVRIWLHSCTHPAPRADRKGR